MADYEAYIESGKLLTIFPEEIWMVIFENIFQPEELLHFTTSSGFFGMLFRNQRTKTLFPEIIKILAAKHDNLPSFRHGTHGKITKQLLNCRLVCRTWQIGVDVALQSSSNYNKLLAVACHQSLSISGSSRDAHFSLPQQLVAFLQQFGGNYAPEKRNPFIGRSLFIYYSDQITDFESFTQHLLQILASYGHHIWNFGLFLAFLWQPAGLSNVWFYERLRDFLQLMPNLKVLKLRCGADGSNDEWKALELSLESCVFPKLDDLTYLQLETVPTPVFDALLRRYSHVNMLSSRTWLGRSDMLVYTHKMPNVTQIALSMKDINTLIQWDTSNDLWPLKTLIIRLTVFQPQLDWQTLFRFLESRWAATLIELKIDFFHVGSYDSHPTQDLPPLKLPNLKVFALELGLRAPPLQGTAGPQTHGAVGAIFARTKSRARQG